MIIRHGAAMARQLAEAYLLLVIYASLHPLSGWSATGAPLFEFLWAPWPRYYTVLDLILNVCAYLPLGLLLVPALRPRLKPGAAVVAAVAIGAALSLTLETVQNFLPSRVPSNLDLATNVIGTFIGALLGVRFGRTFVGRSGLVRWRTRRIIHGRTGDAGLALILIWLVALLSPENFVFGNGDLRPLLGLGVPLAFTVERYLAIEQGIVASGTVAAGLVFWQLMRTPSPWLLAALFVAALLVKTLAGAILVDAHELGQWITPGSLIGLGIGCGVLVATLFVPRQVQTVVAALALLAGTAMVNLAPENPYLGQVQAQWQQGHFLNFNGLTRLASTLWPFLALAFLMAARPQRDTDPPDRGYLMRSPP